jgi:hypothetical protein
VTYSHVERGFLCPRGHARYPHSNHAPDCTPACHAPGATLDQVGGWVWTGNLSGWEAGASGVHHRCGYFIPWQDEGLWDGRYLGNLVELLVQLRPAHVCAEHRGHDCSEHGGVTGG